MKTELSDKRQAILDATLQLVAKQGLHNTPMSQVSKTAGVSAGAIYHYFASKDILINELYVEVKQEINKAIFTSIDGDLSVKEQFLQMWLISFRYFEQHAEAFNFIEQCANSPLITAETKDKVLQLSHNAFEFVEQAIAQGLLKPMGSHLILALTYGAIVSLLKLKHEDPEAVDEQAQQAVALFCWDGIAV